MTASLGLGVATTGLLVAIVGTVCANVVFFRSLPKMLDRVAVRAAPNIAFNFVFWLLVWAAVGMIGIAILLLGLSFGGGVVMWAPLAPTAIVVLIIPMAWYLRWRIRQVRRG